jgi:hypothetical protein
MNWTDGDMRRYVRARTVGWSRCMGPGFSSTSTSTHVDCTAENTIRILLYIPDLFLSFFSLSFFWYWFILQSLYSLGHVFCVILPCPFFFLIKTPATLSLPYSPFLPLLYVLTCYSGQTKGDWAITLDGRISFVRLFMSCCGVRHKIWLISFWKCFLFNVSRTRLEKAVDIWTWLPWTVCGFQ